MSKRLYLVFVNENAIPFLQSTGFIKVEELGSYHYFICTKIEEKSHFFLDVHFTPETAQTDFDYEVSLPYQYILYVVAAEKPNLNKILGFHTYQKVSDIPKEKQIP